MDKYIAVYKDDTETEHVWGPMPRYEAAIKAANHINGMMNTKDLNPSTDFMFSLNKLRSAILNARNPVVLTLDEYGIAVELYKAKEFQDIMSWTYRAIIEDIKAAPELLACRTVGDMHDITDANCLGGLCDGDHPLSYEYATQFREWNGLDRLQERVNLFLDCHHTPAGYARFEDFQATRRRVSLDEARDIVGDELDYMDIAAVWLYWTHDCPLYILECDNGDYSLILERSDWITPDIEELERRLYLWAVDEVIERENVKEFMFVPIEGSAVTTPLREGIDFFCPDHGFDFEEQEAIDSLEVDQAFQVHGGGAGQWSVVVRIK